MPGTPLLFQKPGQHLCFNEKIYAKVMKKKNVRKIPDRPQVHCELQSRSSLQPISAVGQGCCTKHQVYSNAEVLIAVPSNSKCIFKKTTSILGDDHMA